MGKRLAPAFLTTLLSAQRTPFFFTHTQVHLTTLWISAVICNSIKQLPVKILLQIPLLLPCFFVHRQYPGKERTNILLNFYLVFACHSFRCYALIETTVTTRKLGNALPSIKQTVRYLDVLWWTEAYRPISLSWLLSCSACSNKKKVSCYIRCPTHVPNTLETNDGY